MNGMLGRRRSVRVARRRGLSRVRLGVMLLAALGVVAAVAAAPVAAIPATPTTLTLTAQSGSVNWSKTAVLNGVLQTTADPPVPLDEQLIEVQYSTTKYGPWVVAATVTNTAAPYTSGEYTYSWAMSRNYYWRMHFAAAGEWAESYSRVLYVKAKPILGKPQRPKSVKVGAKFKVYGSLKPRFAAGSKTVKIKVQRYVKGKWKQYKTYKATNSNKDTYSRYTRKFAIKKKGKYRVYGTTYDTSSFGAAKSKYSSPFKVM